MNVKLYYAPERDTAGRPVTYSDGGRFAGFVRRGRIESYYTRADGSAAITMEYLGVSPDGLKVELWSALEDDPGDALDSRAAACGDERGYAAASEAAARTTSDSRQFVRALAAMPEELAAQGYRAADPFDFFNIAASTLGIYRVDVDGEVYWPAGEETERKGPASR